MTPKRSQSHLPLGYSLITYHIYFDCLLRQFRIESPEIEILQHCQMDFTVIFGIQIKDDAILTCHQYLFGNIEVKIGHNLLPDDERILAKVNLRKFPIPQIDIRQLLLAIDDTYNIL